MDFTVALILQIWTHTNFKFDVPIFCIFEATFHS